MFIESEIVSISERNLKYFLCQKFSIKLVKKCQKNTSLFPMEEPPCLSLLFQAGAAEIPRTLSLSECAHPTSFLHRAETRPLPLSHA